MQLWKKMKKNRKGFTLVEIIVVLVILAILAAFTIPAMLGFVKDARAKASIAQAREVYVAAQAAATEVGAGKAIELVAEKNDAAAKAIKDKTEAQVGTDVKGDNNAAFVATVTFGSDAPEDPTTNGTAAIVVNATTTQVEYVSLKVDNTTLVLKNGGEVTVK